MSVGPQSVLVIDDAQDIHDLVEVRLRADGIELRHALDADSGLAMARAAPPDLFLLDLDLPGGSGLDVCRALQADPQLATVPVIVLTGTVDVATKVQAFEAGAVDYVTKPFDAVELRARVGAALRTKRYLDLLATRAQLDGLTGLWNRAYLDWRLREEVAAAARYRRQLALMIVDVDHFKSINDSCGHPFGDLVLRGVADILATCLRPGDVACRYGGDEFVVVLSEADVEAAQASAQRIRDAVLGLGLSQSGRRVPVHVSVGYATAARMPNPGLFSPNDLIAAADRGLYAAKRRGGNRIADGQRLSPEQLDDTLAGPAEEPAVRVLGPGSRIARYEVLELIAGGAMGTVYRAFDQRELRTVALKVLHPMAVRSDGWRRFAQEARTLAALDHPNIVRVLDHGVSSDAVHYLVLELLTGCTVRARLFDGPFAFAPALTLSVALVQALAAAHDKGIVHRDLKPENLFLLASGGLKILDFGLAKVLAPADDANRVQATEAGILLGTAGYLAPEQARGQPVDARSDLFSVGAILYELITGKRAFFRDSTIETLHAVLMDPVPPVGHEGLDAVLARCLAKDPAARFESARALALALSQLLIDADAPTPFDIGYEDTKLR